MYIQFLIVEKDNDGRADKYGDLIEKVIQLKKKMTDDHTLQYFINITHRSGSIKRPDRNGKRQLLLSFTRRTQQ